MGLPTKQDPVGGNWVKPTTLPPQEPGTSCIPSAMNSVGRSARAQARPPKAEVRVLLILVACRLSQHALGSWQAFEQDWAVQNTHASRGPTRSTGFHVAADGCLGTTDGTRVPLLSPSQKDVFFINSPSSLASFPHTDSDLHRRPPPRADALSTYLSLISILAKDKNHRGTREQGDN